MALGGSSWGPFQKSKLFINSFSRPLCQCMIGLIQLLAFEKEFFPFKKIILLWYHYFSCFFFLISFGFKLIPLLCNFNVCIKRKICMKVKILQIFLSHQKKKKKARNI